MRALHLQRGLFKGMRCGSSTTAQEEESFVPMGLIEANAQDAASTKSYVYSVSFR